MYDPAGNHPIVPYVSLCSGYEGIGLGLHRCIPNLRTIAYCEREIFGAANLCAKIEAGLLDPAPIFADVCSFPWSEFAPVMAQGILSFGWPCQPVSHAGKRKATEDERWLFDIIADGIGAMRPGWLFAENVEGLLSARMPDGSSVFGHCITRLERLHYKVAAGIFSAAEVGAPHQRKRVFILAYDQRQRIEELGRQIAVGSQQHSAWHNGGMGNTSSTRHAGPTRSSGECAQGQSLGHVAESNGCLWPSRPGEPQHWWEPPRVVGGLADTASAGSGSEGGDVVHQGWSSSDAWAASVSQDTEWQAGAAIADDQSAGRDGGELGDANQLRPQRCDDTGSLQAVGVSRAELAGDGDQPVGNAMLSGSSSERPSGRQQDGFGQPSDGTMGHANSPRPQERTRQRGSAIQGADADGGEAAERQTQPSLGRNPNGPADWLDDAELFTTCDNRTDELRLLGNGVVPATAERAFRVLVGELMEHRP